MTAPSPDRLAALFARGAHGIKFDLEPVRAVLAEIGNPHETFAAIHVAGTNGKGSVCAMIESVLRAAGFRTGLFTSPHLVRFNERFAALGEEIGDDDLGEIVDLVSEADARAAARPGLRPLTFFEFSTAIAFEFFRRRRVQLAVVETGMGGRLDATNVVCPLVSVLTQIGLDHMAYLGNTIGEIAGEKCGIIKEERPVVVRGDEEYLPLIERIARERRAPLIRSRETVSIRRLAQTPAGQRIKLSTAGRDLPPFVLPLPGRHQLDNCAQAIAALETAADALGIPMSDEAFVRGLEQVRWPGRCQLLHDDPPVYLDVAHNPSGAAALASTLRDFAQRRPVGLVCGMLLDKDSTAYAAALTRSIAHVWTVPIRDERGKPPDRLAEELRAGGMKTPSVCAAWPEALEQALAWARDDGGIVCIAGSLFLAGEVLGAIENGTWTFQTKGKRHEP